MNTENNKLQGLLYLEEHIACNNYLTGDRALFETIKLEAGKLFIRESMDVQPLSSFYPEKSVFPQRMW